MNQRQIKKNIQKILVFQQNGSGENKVRGIEFFGKERFQIEKISISNDLPPVVDDTRPFLPEKIEADLVIDYLKHPDLSYDLAKICKNNGITEVATRKKIKNNWVYTPPICCALARHDKLGEYGMLFGLPEFDVEIVDGKLVNISVSRGAPCGATWDAAKKVIGMERETALKQIGLETQYLCKADPSDWDPLWGKSPVHLAADLHSNALLRAINMRQESQ
jgi:hypothetical protein